MRDIIFKIIMNITIAKVAMKYEKENNQIKKMYGRH